MNMVIREVIIEKRVIVAIFVSSLTLWLTHADPPPLQFLKTKNVVQS